jgi:hypothetical protein
MSRSEADRRKAIRVAKDALQQIAGQFPTQDGVYKILMGQEEGDLVAAAIDQRIILSGATFLENALESAIVEHLRSDIEAKEINKLFRSGEGGPGILSTFDAKIQIARALGILSEQAADDLRIIQTIRNHFAHAPLTTSFEQDEIKKLILLLHRAPFANLDTFLIPRELIISILIIYHGGIAAARRGDIVTHESWPRF